MSSFNSIYIVPFAMECNTLMGMRAWRPKSCQLLSVLGGAISVELKE
jgi:hypothetical protein